MFPFQFLLSHSTQIVCPITSEIKWRNVSICIERYFCVLFPLSLSVWYLHLTKSIPFTLRQSLNEIASSSAFTCYLFSTPHLRAGRKSIDWSYTLISIGDLSSDRHDWKILNYIYSILRLAPPLKPFKFVTMYTRTSGRNTFSLLSNAKWWLVGYTTLSTTAKR